jgi:hypothetical protein
MGYYLDDHSDEKHHHKSQLWCKAIIYFLLNVQIQMVESHSFEKLT